MRPTIKRALVSTLVTGALVIGASTPGLATEDTATALAETTSNLTSETTEADAVTEENTSEKSESDSEADAPAEITTEAGTPAHSTPSAPVAGPTLRSAEPAETAAVSDTIAVTEAYANWDFRRGFREYVGIENETLSGGLQILDKGKHLLWQPHPGQTFNLDGSSGLLKFAGQINWTKYDGILNVRIANPTIDFANKVLLVDGYTAGTLAKAGEVTFTQTAIASLPDLKIEKHNGYVVISSHKPIFNERVKDLVGLYQNEMAAPLVVTVATDNSEDTDTPQPVLWELFPTMYKNPVNGPVYTDAPLTNVSIPDPNLEACIRTYNEIAPGIPLTNRHLESLQQLKCINKGIKSLKGLEHAVNLNWVNFYANQINDLTPLAQASKLKVVEVGKNQLTTLTGLENSPLINQLSAEENYITDASVVKKLIRIDTLDLHDNRISDLSQVAVQTYDDEKISTVNLSHNRIADLSQYDSMPFIRDLNLSHNLISDLGRLPHKRGFERLNLEHNFITDPSAFGAWATDRYRGSFERLKIRYNKFTDWTPLKPLADQDKVFYYPESGSSDTLVNPKTLEELKTKHSATDAEIAQAEQARRDEEEKARKAAEEALIKSKTWNAQLTWGVKQSFRDYVAGDFAGGKWTVADGVKGSFEFPLLADQKINPLDHNRISFGGKVHFVAHHDILDMTIANPSIENEAGVWKLYADVATRPFDKSKLGHYLGLRASGEKAPLAPVSELKRSEIAVLTQLTESLQNSTKVLHFGKVTLTPEGSLAFAKFYEPNQVMDTLNVTIKEGTPNGVRSVYSPMTDTPAQPEETYTADLSWGVKESFRTYIKGDLAQGDWKLSGGVTGEFVFPLKDGVKVSPDNYEALDFKGTVHFKGHHGLLNLAISQPSIAKVNGKWELTATVTSTPFDKKDIGKYLGANLRVANGAPETRRVVIANLSEPTVKVDGKLVSLAFATVTLTDAGSVAFAKFYEPGQVLDALTVGIRPVTAPAPSQPGKTDSDKPKADAPVVSAPTQKQNTKPAEPAKPQIKKCEVDPTKKRITGGNLAWGVRASFTSYIRGSIAHGGWNLNGTSWDGANFNWAATGGVYNTATKSGTIYYGGAVNFYGHDGILDLTISNPSLVINGNYGALYVTVNGSDMSGKKFNLGRVHFADVALGGVYEANGTLNFQNATVTLTAAGAKAFVGFYSTGAALAPMSSSVSMVNATACDPATGELIEYGAFGGVLSQTGVEVEGMLLASLATLFAGVAALAMRRRQLR